jgi:hypothetical protein
MAVAPGNPSARVFASNLTWAPAAFRQFRLDLRADLGKLSGAAEGDRQVGQVVYKCGCEIRMMERDRPPRAVIRP